MDLTPVTDRRTDGRLTWWVEAGPAEEIMAALHPGRDVLMTDIQIAGPGVNEGWGFGGPPLEDGKRVEFMYGRAQDGTEFVIARFDPTLPALHLETTRRVITVDARRLPVHFGLKFWAQPIPADEEFVTAYGDPSESPPLGWAPQRHDG
ncbi:hypothetical protein ACFYTQ_13490 [Nocardia sp. NPDC004068]|uniref:hypothetical protein n=1 Tax=Nocardia sp. NPDC004068 TaxID=3364303 RepID=UPI003690D016